MIRENQSFCDCCGKTVSYEKLTLVDREVGGKMYQFEWCAECIEKEKEHNK